MFGLGAGELLVIFVLALIFIGPKKLPELAKGLGKGIREFQKAKDDIMDDINKPDTQDQKIDSELENSEKIADEKNQTSPDNLVNSKEKDQTQNNTKEENSTNKTV